MGREKYLEKLKKGDCGSFETMPYSVINIQDNYYTTTINHCFSKTIKFVVRKNNLKIIKVNKNILFDSIC